MNQYKKTYELKNAAKDKLQGKYGASILILITCSVITGIVSLLINAIASTTTATVYAMTNSSATVNALNILFDIIQLAASILLGIMEAGIALFFLNAACGQPYATRNLFYGFTKDSGKALTLSFVWGGCSGLCLYPYQYFLNDYLNTHNTRMLYSAAIALIVGACIYIPIYLNLSMVFYLMLDYPDLSAKETLALSVKIMRGHKGRLFYLNLSFVPMMFLCLLSFGIGFLWLNPYMRMTSTCFFLDIMDPAKASYEA